MHDPKDEWEIPSSVYQGKGWLQASEETDATAHEDERWDTELIYPGLIPTTEYFPHPYICLNYHNVAGRTTAPQELRNNGWRRLCHFTCVTQAKPSSAASRKAWVPSVRKATLIPAHTQITASAMDRSVLGDLQRIPSVFGGREKDFSFCQCKQLARPCFGFLQIKGRVGRDSAPKTYLNWLWEVRIHMPVALADKEYNLFPLTRDNLPSLHCSPLGCKTRLPTGQGSFQSWGQPIAPRCRGSGDRF